MDLENYMSRSITETKLDFFQKRKQIVNQKRWVLYKTQVAFGLDSEVFKDIS